VILLQKKDLKMEGDLSVLQSAEFIMSQSEDVTVDGGEAMTQAAHEILQQMKGKKYSLATCWKTNELHPSTTDHVQAANWYRRNGWD